MVGLATVALIERKADISRDLFSRYWRDVHGVMAARIPGFDSYTQYHVTPLDSAQEPFEGIAIVTFATEADRAGLATSAVTRHIHRDEQNVFRRALLYNLDAGARETRGDADRSTGVILFFVVPEGCDPAAVVAAVGRAGAQYCDSYDLRSGDPSRWNETDMDDAGQGRRFVALVHAGWADADGARAAALAVGSAAAAYRLDEMHIMVERGYPTPVGLRGLDAVRTILEAGADNQLSGDVVRAVYGPALAGKQ